jgi:hypothetical protein
VLVGERRRVDDKRASSFSVLTRVISFGRNKYVLPFFEKMFPTI